MGKPVTAFLVVLRDDNRLDVLTDIGGVEVERKPTGDDLYRLICQLKMDLEATRIAQATIQAQAQLARQAADMQLARNLRKV